MHLFNIYQLMAIGLHGLHGLTVMSPATMDIISERGTAQIQHQPLEGNLAMEATAMKQETVLSHFLNVHVNH